MIEETSRAMARDRRRLAILKNLSVWQETARRHAHEMRTPLTAARLELARLQQFAGRRRPARKPARWRRAWARSWTAWAASPSSSPPSPACRSPGGRVHDLGQVVEEFVATFAAAWPNLDLRFEAAGGRPLPAVASIATCSARCW